MSKTATRLGKGLNAIVGPRKFTTNPTASDTPPARAPSERPHLRDIPLDRIRPNQRQPRTRVDEASLTTLAASIRTHGILQPLIVRPVGDAGFELVAGERRWRAARLAGLQSVPAIIRDVTDAESLEAALIENIQREDLGPLERAAAYEQYLETFGVTVDQLALRLAESRSSISNHLRVLKLRVEIRDLIAAGQLGMGQARALAGIADGERQLSLATVAARRNLSVRQVEALSRSEERPAQHVPSAAPSDRHIAEIERAFSRELGVSVKLFSGKKKNSGRIVIRYGTLEEFDRIAERIGGKAVVEA